MASQRRVVIAAYDDRLRRGLRHDLEALGYVTWGEASDGLAALSQVRRSRPHLVVLAPPLSGLDGAEVAETLIRGQLAPVLIVMPEDDPRDSEPGQRGDDLPAAVDGPLADRAGTIRELSVCARLRRPFSPSALGEAAELATRRFERLVVIRDELKRLRRERGGSRLLERAKSLLMRRFTIGEPEAFWRIQRFCLDSSEPARAAVEAVIEANRLVADDSGPEGERSSPRGKPVPSPPDPSFS